MTIDEIREIVISPDAIMRKEWGKVLLNEIDRLTLENNHLKRLTSGVDEAKSINHWKARAEKAEVLLKHALPNLECTNMEQSALITAIGIYLNPED